MATTRRSAFGEREWWKTGRENVPSEAEREAAKKALRPYLESPEAFCPGCERHFLIPTVYSSVKKHGVCMSCYHYITGLSDGVTVRRPPTLEEALAVPVDDLRPAEIRVLRAKLVELLENGSGTPAPGCRGGHPS